ncbi:MAG: PP2C family protein-serine/threonine phosphatase [Oscillospiraceae bacterium]
MDFSARVEIGIKETNDDRCLIGGYIIDNAAYSCEQEFPSYAVVCDGCGGYAGGNIAAETALLTFAQSTATELLNSDYLQNVLEKCSKAVMDKKDILPQYSQMCTTIVGCVFGEKSINIFHSGDSRVYRFDGNALARMTVDHSVVREMIDYGNISEQEAMEKYQRNTITRCLGVESLPPEIYISNSPIMSGEKYVLCTDGLWEWVSDTEMKTILSKDISVSDMVNELVDKARANGSDDNITACICSAKGIFNTRVRKPLVLE